MWCCKYCKNSFEGFDTSQKANHSRWCIDNPKILTYRQNEAIKIASNRYRDKQLGEKKSFQVSCVKCQIFFDVIERENKFPSKTEYFCSRKCANSRVISDEHKLKTSVSVNGYFEKTKHERELNNKTYIKPCANCNVDMRLTYHNYKKKFCSVECRRQQYKKSKYDDTLLNYRANCAFKFSLNSYPDEFDFSLIETHGWYKAKNHGDNLHGVSRDHMLSVRYGFDNDIDPMIVSHPANCRLMIHNENVSKGTSCEITLDELLNRIKDWDIKYPSKNDAR